ncbi:hypothetical protein AC1031_005160 [Aphanomyces cochlioides]|nr:hypothetical protein AC1031_005160 [Aphanomyces cochlioides]
MHQLDDDEYVRLRARLRRPHQDDAPGRRLGEPNNGKSMYTGGYSGRLEQDNQGRVAKPDDYTTRKKGKNSGSTSSGPKPKSPKKEKNSGFRYGYPPKPQG